MYFGLKEIETLIIYVIMIKLLLFYDVLGVS